MVSKTNRLYLRFTSDQSKNFRGFKIRYAIYDNALSQYYLTEPHELCSDHGKISIRDQSECFTAAGSLPGQTFDESETEEGWPRGCYSYMEEMIGYFYWNDHPTGGRNKDARSVCMANDCLYNPCMNGGTCFVMNQQGFSCTCPKHCNGSKCENCTKAKFQLETGYPALMFFNKGKTKGILHRGPRDLITLADFVYEQLDGEHTNVRNESTKMLEAGCKEKDWEYDKNGEPYEYSWKPSGILLETGVCIENTYRKEFVPRKGVTRVHSTIEYQKVRDVDAKKKTISMDFTLTMRWLDKRIKAHLRNNESGIVLGPNSVNHIWTPDVRILNRTSFKSKNELFSLVGAKVLTRNETKN